MIATNIVLAIALLWTLQRLGAARVETALTTGVVGELDSLGEDLLDAEAGQVGYLLTRDDADLD